MTDHFPDTQLQAYLTARMPLSADVWARIRQRFVPVRYARGTHLLKVGQVCGFLGYLETGYLMYACRHGGAWATKYFTWPDTLFTATASFMQGAPTNERITALTDAVVWQISRKDLDELYVEVPALQGAIRGVLQQVFQAGEAIMLEARNLTAEERYARLLASDPELLRAVKVKDMASYLGISPDSLSRIRRKLAAADRQLAQKASAIR